MKRTRYGFSGAYRRKKCHVTRNFYSGESDESEDLWQEKTVETKFSETESEQSDSKKLSPCESEGLCLENTVEEECSETDELSEKLSSSEDSIESIIENEVAVDYMDSEVVEIAAAIFYLQYQRAVSDSALKDVLGLLRVRVYNLNYDILIFYLL